jgi:hypothetical protein
MASHVHKHLASMHEVYPVVYPPDPPPEPRHRTPLTWFGDLWCRMFHRKVMMPIHGYYQCRSCFRRIPVSLDTERHQDHSHSRRQR